ncbi:MAG TPA: AraC family transcriptional regulator [Ktedonosporobacter sp.]|nr:AraC family transcriptional regulator [Ktedonosporobacter sp.]
MKNHLTVLHTYHESSDLQETLFPACSDIHLTLVTSGAIQISERDIDGAWISYPIHEGDWCLTPAGGEPYILRWKSLSPDPLKTLHLHLSADVFARTVQQVTDRDPLQVVVQEHPRFQDPLLAHLGFSLLQELQRGGSDSVGKLYAETAAQMLATHLLRHYATIDLSIPEYNRKLSSQQMRRLTSFIRDQLRHNLSLELLAQQVGFSPYHFARLFRQATGESPHQFVLRQRLAAASCLLKETDMPLAQIASEVGIPNQSHFTQAFKRYRGMTPRAYRQSQ